MQLPKSIQCRLEETYGYWIGCALVAVGLVILKSANLATGGMEIPGKSSLAINRPT